MGSVKCILKSRVTVLPLFLASLLPSLLPTLLLSLLASLPTTIFLIPNPAYGQAQQSTSRICESDAVDAHHGDKREIIVSTPATNDPTTPSTPGPSLPGTRGGTNKDTLSVTPEGLIYPASGIVGPSQPTITEVTIQINPDTGEPDSGAGGVVLNGPNGVTLLVAPALPTSPPPPAPPPPGGTPAPGQPLPPGGPTPGGGGGGGDGLNCTDNSPSEDHCRNKAPGCKRIKKPNVQPDANGKVECVCVCPPPPPEPPPPPPETGEPSSTTGGFKTSINTAARNALAQWRATGTEPPDTTDPNDPDDQSNLQREHDPNAYYFSLAAPDSPTSAQYPFLYPFMQFSLNLTRSGEELQTYTNGNLLNFRLEHVTGWTHKFVLSWQEDPWGNRKEYLYDGAGNIIEERFLGVKTNFAHSVVSGGKRIEVTRSACSMSFTNCTPLGDSYGEVYQYDAQSRLITYTAPESTFVPDPQNNALYDLNTTTGRLETRYTYSPQHGNLTKKEEVSPTGAVRTLYTIEWTLQGTPSAWKVAKVTDGAGYEKNFSYGTGTITVDDGYKSSRYTYDTMGRFTELEVTPHISNGLSIAGPLIWKRELLIPNYGCPVVSRYEEPTGREWRGFYDMWFRLVKTTQTSPAKDDDVVETEYTYGTVYEGNPLFAVNTNGVVRELFYKWQKIKPLDSRFRVTRISSAQSFTRADGVKETHTADTHFNPLGLKTKSVVDGIATVYKRFGADKRHLIKETLSGRHMGVSGVNESATDTVRAAVEREWPFGYITKHIEGPPSTPRVMAEVRYNPDGSVSEVQSGENAKERFFYTSFGEPAAHLVYNRDSSGGKVKGVNGVPSGGDWFRSDTFYDSNGRVVKVASDFDRASYAPADWGTLEKFEKTEVTYHPFGLPNTVTTQMGSVTLEYNALFGRWKTVLNNGPVINEIITGLNSVTERSLVGSNKYTTTSVEFNRAGLPVRSTSPIGNVTELKYGNFGETKEQKNYKGGTILSKVSFAHDELLRVIKGYIHNPQNDSTTLVGSINYGKFGVDEVYDQFPNHGPAVSYNYDGTGRVVAVSRRGTTTNYKYSDYDSFLVEVSEELAPGKKFITAYLYDGLGRVIEEQFFGTSNQPKVTKVKYNSLGVVDWEEDVEGIVTTAGIRADGFIDWQKRQDTLLGQAARFWQGNKQKVSVTDISGQKLEVTRGLFGVEEVSGPIGSYKYTYDAASNLLKVTEPASATELRYDQFGRVVNVKSASQLSGVSPVTLVRKYDEFGRAHEVQVSDAAGVTTARLEFDAYGAVVSKKTKLPSGVEHTTGYSFTDSLGVRDFSGRIHGLSLSGVGEVRNHFDPITKLLIGKSYNGNLDGVPTDLTSYVYDGTIPSEFIMPGGRRTQTVYDEYGALSQVTTFSPSGQVEEEAKYIRDVAGRVTQLQQTAGGNSGSGAGRAFKYEPLFGRLLGAKTFSDPLDYGRGYDQIGSVVSEAIYSFTDNNPLQRESLTITGAGATSKNYTYDDKGRVVTFNGGQISYDAVGRMTQLYDGRELVYDSGGKLIQVLDGGGAVLQSFGYDTAGRLMFSGAGGDTYRRIGTQMVAREDASGVKFFYDRHPDVPEEKVATYKRSSSGPMQEYNTTYVLGSPYSTYGQNELSEGYGFKDITRSVYPAGSGGSQSSSTLGIEEGYHGMDFDRESGLVYANARWLDPGSALFTSFDPIVKPFFLYDYGYTLGDHINTQDRTGLQANSLPSQRGSVMRPDNPTLWQRAKNWWNYEDSFVPGYTPKEARKDAEAEGFIKGLKASVASPTGLLNVITGADVLSETWDDYDEAKTPGEAVQVVATAAAVTGLSAVGGQLAGRAIGRLASRIKGRFGRATPRPTTPTNSVSLELYDEAADRARMVICNDCPDRILYMRDPNPRVDADNSDVQRLIAQLRKRGVKIKVTKGLVRPGDPDVLGVYNPVSQQITVPKSTNVHVLIHEWVHSIQHKHNTWKRMWFREYIKRCDENYDIATEMINLDFMMRHQSLLGKAFNISPVDMITYSNEILEYSNLLGFTTPPVRNIR